MYCLCTHIYVIHLLKAQTGSTVIHDRGCLWGGRETELRGIQGGEASILTVTFSNTIF